MSNPNATSPDSLLQRLALAPTAHDRSAVLEQQPDLRSASTVQALCEQAHQWQQTDLPLAKKAAQAALWLAETLGHQPSEALAHRTNANVLEALSHSSQAFAEYEKALELFLLSKDQLQVAVTKSSAIAAVTNTLGPEEAFRWADQARQVFLAENDRLRLARLENNLATVFFRQEDFTRALEHWQLAHTTLKGLGLVSDQAITLTNLATCFISLNRPSEAQHYYNSARTLCQEHNLIRLLHLVEYNIAYLYYLQGEHDTALNLYKRARETSRANQDTYFEGLCNLDESEIYLELNLLSEASTVAQLAEEQFRQISRPYEAAKAQFNHALVALRRREPHRALRLLAAARAVFLQEGNLLWPGKVDFLQALTLLGEGRHFESRRAAERARAGFERSGLARHRAVAELLLARIALALDAPDLAESYIDQALTTILEFHEPESVFQANFVLAEVQDYLGNTQAAVDALREAERHLQELRERVIAPPSKTHLVEDPLQVYANLVSLLLNASDDKQHALELFTLIERSNLRGPADLGTLRAAQMRSGAHVRSQLVDQVSVLRSELNWLYRRIDASGLQDKTSNSSYLADLQRQGQKKERALSEILGRSEAKSSSSQGTMQSLQVADLDKLRQRLGDSVIVEYFLADDLIVALTLSSGQLRIRPVAVESTVRELQRRLWYYFEHPQQRAVPLGSSLNNSLHRILADLYTELLEPVQDCVGSHPLIIVPHGFLNYLPFHAFVESGGFLFEGRIVSYVPSATSLMEIETTRQESSASCFLELSNAGSEQSVIPRLSRAEVVRMSQDSSELGLKLDGRHWSGLHLATDTVLRHDSPVFSTFRLGADRIPLFELHQRRLPCSILTLEGLELQARQVSEGEEVAALWRALLASGVITAIVPLWPAPHKAQRRLIELFYAELLCGAGTGPALMRAMAIAKDEATTFLEWASCALVGEPNFVLLDRPAAGSPDHS